MAVRPWVVAREGALVAPDLPPFNSRGQDKEGSIASPGRAKTVPKGEQIHHGQQEPNIWHKTGGVQPSLITDSISGEDRRERMESGARVEGY